MWGECANSFKQDSCLGNVNPLGKVTKRMILFDFFIAEQPKNFTLFCGLQTVLIEA